MTYYQFTSSQSLSKAQGEEGERFALEYERKRLPDYLHGKIVHLGEFEIARGYDILSFETKDDLTPDRCIEVKTYRGQPHFFWTDNEIESARNHAEHFYLYLVDYDHIKDPAYEPMIIQNPFLVFKDLLPTFYSATSRRTMNSKWAVQIPQYLITLLSNENIPEDWDDAIVLLGCYKSEAHLNWIRSHMLYNVRNQKNVPGSVDIKNPLVQNAKYLLLYNVSSSQVYFLYSLEPDPYLRNKNDMVTMGYPDPRCYYYTIHPLAQNLGTFFINLAPLLRKINHRDGNTYGTPQYFPGIQLRQFMITEEPPKFASDPLPNLAESQQQYKRDNFWSEEEEQQLMNLLNSHTPISDIAYQLHHKESYIIGHMGHLRANKVISYDLYIHYYNNDSAFASKKKYNESNRRKQ